MTDLKDKVHLWHGIKEIMKQAADRIPGRHRKVDWFDTKNVRKTNKGSGKRV